jgi:hypothetical protein
MKACADEKAAKARAIAALTFIDYGFGGVIEFVVVAGPVGPFVPVVVITGA